MVIRAGRTSEECSSWETERQGRWSWNYIFHWQLGLRHTATFPRGLQRTICSFRGPEQPLFRWRSFWLSSISSLAREWKIEENVEMYNKNRTWFSSQNLHVHVCFFSFSAAHKLMNLSAGIVKIFLTRWRVTLQLLLLVTAQKERRMLMIFFLPSFCQLLYPPATLSWDRLIASRP